MNPDSRPERAADSLADRVRRLERRLERERRARREAELLIEAKSRELYDANLALNALATELEQRVSERTRDLSIERERALHMAEIDTLTGIANRTSFERQLAEVLADPLVMTRGVAALLVDLDDFKTVNDTMGHAAGDALLVEVARRLVMAVRPGDVVARLGGDEFAIIAHAPRDREGALALAHWLRHSLCRPVQIEGRSLPCNCSIGVAESIEVAADPDELLRDADLALYAAKRAGRGRATLFEPAMRHDVERRTALDLQVRSAVIDGEIEPWYQPIFCAHSGRYIGAEVLARWRTAAGQIRTPGEFLGSVESQGLLDRMMEAMLPGAFTEARDAIKAGSLDYLSINVSPAQFNQGWVLTRLPQLLAAAAFPTDALVVEITETALLLDAQRTREILANLAALGVRIALDDFGVGYSNFSMLRRLPLDLVKLDRTLVCDIETDEHACALAEGILNLAARLRMKVIGEGVETQRQAELLAAAGCAALQGYWFSPPRRSLSAALAPAPQLSAATLRVSRPSQASSAIDSAAATATQASGTR